MGGAMAHAPPRVWDAVSEAGGTAGDIEESPLHWVVDSGIRARRVVITALHALWFIHIRKKVEHPT